MKKYLLFFLCFLSSLGAGQLNDNDILSIIDALQTQNFDTILEWSTRLEDNEINIPKSFFETPQCLGWSIIKHCGCCSNDPTNTPTLRRSKKILGNIRLNTSTRYEDLVIEKLTNECSLMQYGYTGTLLHIILFRLQHLTNFEKKFKLYSIIEQIITNGPNSLQIFDSFGLRPLHIATLLPHDKDKIESDIVELHRNVVKTLLNFADNIDILTRQGLTPLHLAASQRNIYLMYLFLITGANPVALSHDELDNNILCYFGFRHPFYSVITPEQLLIRSLEINNNKSLNNKSLNAIENFFNRIGSCHNRNKDVSQLCKKLYKLLKALNEENYEQVEKLLQEKEHRDLRRNNYKLTRSVIHLEQRIIHLEQQLSDFLLNNNQDD